MSTNAALHCLGIALGKQGEVESDDEVMLSPHINDASPPEEAKDVAYIRNLNPQTCIASDFTNKKRNKDKQTANRPKHLTRTSLKEALAKPQE